jgi:hypothetical protein
MQNGYVRPRSAVKLSKAERTKLIRDKMHPVLWVGPDDRPGTAYRDWNLSLSEYV